MPCRTCRFQTMNELYLASSPICIAKSDAYRPYVDGPPLAAMTCFSQQSFNGGFWSHIFCSRIGKSARSANASSRWHSQNRIASPFIESGTTELSWPRDELSISINDPAHAIYLHSSTIPNNLHTVRQFRLVAATPSLRSTFAASFDRPMPSGAYR